MTYHGAEGDPRYPSTRKLRNALAGAVDLLLAFGVLSAVTVPLALSMKAMEPWAPVLPMAAFIITSIANAVLLPVWTGASLGRIIFGLATIRGTDGTRPTLREFARSALRRRGIFFYGPQADAPHLIIVRHQDATAPEIPSPGAYTEL